MHLGLPTHDARRRRRNMRAVAPVPLKMSQLLSGFGAGCLGAVFNLPSDMIRTHVQRDAMAVALGTARTTPPLPLFEVSEFLRAGSSIVAANGVASLWTGFSWKALHLGASGALMAAFLPFWKSVLGVNRE